MIEDINQFQSLTGYPVYARTYSRNKENGNKENWTDTVNRCIKAIKEIGKLDANETALMRQLMLERKSLPSGRFMWVSGTEWSQKTENTFGFYNCVSINCDRLDTLPLIMDLSMQGTGTGLVLEQKYIERLPSVTTKIDFQVIGECGSVPKEDRFEETQYVIDDGTIGIIVGDSRQGWVQAYQYVLEIATVCDSVSVALASPLPKGDAKGEQTSALLQNPECPQELKVVVDISNVRGFGEKLNGFGGVANPVKLKEFFDAIVKILNGAVGRQLTSVELCKIADCAALCVVAGNIRRCLPEYALVHIETGYTFIKDIQVGDLVHTQAGIKKVTDKFDQGFQNVFEIVVEPKISVHLQATLNHRVAVIEDDEIRWKLVEDLDKGDRLKHSEDKVAKVKEIQLVGSIHTYDIEVEDAHAFYCDGFLVHNSANMRQFSKSDEEAAIAKNNLWQVNEQGEWKIDPEKDMLRMSNHTRVFHSKPTLEQCIESVRKQYYSGEGAIQYAPEAIARASADILNSQSRKKEFLKLYNLNKSHAIDFLHDLGKESIGGIYDRLSRYGLNPCGR